MWSRVGICAVAVFGLLCGCADNKPPPVTLARQGLKLVASGDQAQGQALPQPTAKAAQIKPPVSATPITDPYATKTPTRSNVQGVVPPEPTAKRAQSSPPVSATPTHKATVGKDTTHTYVVRQGDTLFKIAKQFYGDGSKWTQIQKANPKITDPGKLQIGEKLMIPG